MTDESLIAYLKNEFIAYRESQSAFSPATPPSQMDLSGQAEPVQRQLDTQSVVLSNEQKEAIENNLRELISYKGQPRQFTTDETQTLIKAIDGLKVLDPACGSGAFPMGVLQKLVFVLERIDPRNEEWKQRQIDKVRSTIQTAEKIEDSTVRDNTIRDLEREIENINDAFARNELGYGRKLYLIENCIYGVDIQPIAVQIAKLRFFISLVVDQKIDRERENLGVRPLPNLETKFVASDALIDVEKPDQIQIRNLHVVRKEIELSEVRRKHFTARTPPTKKKYRDLDTDLRSELSELLKRDGFPDDTTEKIAFWDPYDQNTCADWFDQEWMFNIKVGFDIVLGNPPYINIENLPVKTKNYLFENYQACTGRTDIYVAFLEKSISLLNSKGFMSFILPSAFATQQYGEKMRQVLIESHAIREVVDASSYRIFENATVHNIVLIVGNDKGQHQTKVRLHSNNADFDTRSGTEFCVDQHAFAGLKDSRLETNPLVFESLNVKEKIWQHAVRFDQICFVAYGARLNHRTEKLGKQHYISQSPIPGAKRFCEGKDIERYSFSQDGWLEYTPDEHYNPMFPELFENEKLMFINVVKDRLRFAHDGKGFYNSHTVLNCVRLDLLSRASHVSARRAMRNADKKFAEQFSYGFLLGVLNSRLINWYFQSFLSESLHFYPNDAKQLPIPNATLEQQKPIVQLANRILDTKRRTPDENTSALENDIDELVYSLYELTPEEIAIVKANTV